MSDKNELWASEYGADCFSLGDIGREENGKLDYNQIPGVWWPLYIDDKQVGWAQIDYHGSTSFAIRLMGEHTIEVKTEGKAAKRSKQGKPHTDVEIEEDGD